MEANECLAHHEPAALLGGIEWPLREDSLAHLVVVVVERFDGLEVPVDDHVEQAVQQEADTALGQIGRAIPAMKDRGHREALVLADGDDPPAADERVDLGLVEAPTFAVDSNSMGGEEEM